MIVAATGHRPNKLGGYGPQADQRRRDLAYRWLSVNRPGKVISGAALGWDTAVAEAAYNLGIPFVAAVPFVGQESAWPAPSQATYRALLAAAVEVVIVSPGGYSAAKMQTRNCWMADNSDKMLALWDGSPGGTGNCVAYAESIGREVVNLWREWAQ